MVGSDICFICNKNFAIHSLPPHGEDMTNVSCPCCGEYSVVGGRQNMLKDIVKENHLHGLVINWLINNESTPKRYGLRR